MRNIRIVTLYSGSSGNSTYVKIGDTAILIDAGKSARTLCSRLVEIGSDIKEIKAIFITHEHTDHISALETLSKKNPIPIHMTEKSAERFDRCPDAAIHRCLVRHTPVFSERVGELEVSSFVTPHDSKMSVGYRIEFEDGGERHAVGLATDIGYVSCDIKEGLDGCEAVVLESNHDVDMLKEGPYPYDLKQRILSKRGHLSNSECASFAIDLAERGTKAFILAHLSEENNEPSVAFDEVSSAVSGLGACVFVAEADNPTELVLRCSSEEIYDKR